MRVCTSVKRAIGFCKNNEAHAGKLVHASRQSEETQSHANTSSVYVYSLTALSLSLSVSGLRLPLELMCRRQRAAVTQMRVSELSV